MCLRLLYSAAHPKVRPLNVAVAVMIKCSTTTAGMRISDIVDLWDFHIQGFLEHARNWGKRNQQLCGQKSPVNERGQGRRARLVQADRKSTVTQINHTLKPR